MSAILTYLHPLLAKSWWSQWAVLAAGHCYSWWSWWSNILWLTLQRWWPHSFLAFYFLSVICGVSLQFLRFYLMSPTGNRTAGSNFHSLQFVQHGDFADVRYIIWVEMGWSHLAWQPCLLHAQLHPHQVLDSVYCKWFRGHGKTPPLWWHTLRRPKVYTYIVFTPKIGTYNF